jgi:lysophospholipid acyltransferase (LPLAT)-like uncharacterized protein
MASDSPEVPKPGLRKKRKRISLVLQRLAEGPGSLLIAIVFRVHAWTLRTRVEGLEHVHRVMERGAPVVFIYWHQDLPGSVFCKMKVFTGDPLVTMVSRSRDGELITRIIRWFGIESIRASSSRGGVRGLIELIRWVRSQSGTSSLVGFPLDGPRGPARKAKQGAALVARKVKATVIPFTVRYSRHREFKSWDRTRLAGLFARTIIYFGEAVDAADFSDNDPENAIRMESMLETLHRQADST